MINAEHNLLGFPMQLYCEYIEEEEEEKEKEKEKERITR